MPRETTSWLAHVRRWRWLLVALALIVLVRAVLPYAVRRVLEAQASERLHADVSVGDVDLALYKAGIAVEDLAIRPRLSAAQTTGSRNAAGRAAAKGAKVEQAPTQEPSAAASLPRPSASSSRGTAAEPALAFERLALSVHWLPLLRKAIQLREIELVSPRVRVERLADGSFNYEPLIQAAVAPSAQGEAEGAPSPTPSPTPDASTAASGWQVGIDRFALIGGELRFQDEMLESSEPIEIAIPSVEVHDIALGPEMYGKPSESRVRVMLEQGSIEIGARAAVSGSEVDLQTDLEIQGLPLRQARLYVPGVGWSELEGKLDASLQYALVTGTKNELRGSTSVDQLRIRVPDLDTDALSLERFAVRVDPIDLHGSVAKIADVSVDGLWIVARPSDPRITPLLEAAAGKAREDLAEPARDSKRRAPPAENPPKPWEWSVEAVHIASSGIHLLGADQALDLRLDGQASGLAPGSATRAPVDLTIGAGDGSVQVQGSVRVDPPGFAGDLRIKALALPELVSISGATAENPVSSAKLDADLAIEAGMPKQDGGGASLTASDLRIDGKVALSDAHVTSGGTDAALAGMDLQIEELALSGALAGLAARKDADRSSGPTAAADRSKAGVLRFRGALALRDLDAKLPDLRDFRVAAKSVDLKGMEAELAGMLAPPGEAAAPERGDLRAAARLLLTKPRLALGDGKDFLVELESLNLGLAQVSAPAMRAPQPTAGAKPIRVVASDLRIRRPNVRLTLTSSGLLLPGPGPVPPAPGAVATPVPRGAATGVAVRATAAASHPGAAARPTPTPGRSGAARQTPTPSRPGAAAASVPAGSPGVELALDLLQIADGRVALDDRTLSPPLVTELKDIEADARGIRFPGPTVQRLELELVTPQQGEVRVSGSLLRDSGKIEIDTHDVTLLPYNPYAASYTPYRITSGDLTLVTTVTSSGRRYDVKNSITLHDLDLEKHGEGEGYIEGQMGMPISSILALLRDPAGNIKLQVPVQVSEQGTSVDIAAIVADALRAALVGALTSPLKLVGAMVGGDGKAGFAPRPIDFGLGSAELSPEGAKIIGGLTELMRSRPALGVELKTQAVEADARRLREEALLRSWGEESFFASLTALGERGARARVRRHIEEGEGELTPEDAKQLEAWLREIPKPSAKRLQELGRQRLKAVGDRLRAASIPAARIVESEPSGAVSDGRVPAVDIELRPASRLEPPAGETRAR